MDTPQTSPTSNSDRVPGARHLILPEGIRSSSYARVNAILQSIGVFHDPWQVGLNRCLLAKGADGLYAADTAALSIPRQVGKTFDIGTVMFAECIAEPGTTVVWTAHRFKVARETFNELRSLAKSPLLAAHIDYDAITTAAGNESIPFRNGSRIVFAARERGAIRGFTKVRYLVLDEAQILTHSQLADLAPTMNQAHNPLIILMGTPPKPGDPAEAFTDLREGALTGEATDVLYCEFSADRDADYDDRDQWRKANPSYPARTSERAIKRLRKLLSADDFRREAMGVWDSDAAFTVIPLDVWNDELADKSDEPPRPVGPVVFGVYTDQHRKRTSIVVAGARPDGLPQVQLIESRDGAGWAAARLAELCGQWPNMGVVVDMQSAAAGIADDLENSGYPVIRMGTAEAKQAFGDFYDACVETKRLRHLAQDEMLAALKGAKERIVGDAKLWDQKKSDVDITPIVAATNALWGWTTRHGSALQIF